MIERTRYNNVYESWKNKKRTLYTKNLTAGKSFFGEYLDKDNGVEYRSWDPRRSKVGAAIIKKINPLPLKSGDKVLYLGAAHGYTASYVSDIVGEKGEVYCLDFAARVVRDLYFVCEERKNMAPLLADAKKPEEYKELVGKVDVIIQDIAQKEQVKILFKNLDFLKEKGYVLLAVKARSIDVTKRPEKIFKQVEEELRTRVKVLDKKDLNPLEKGHMFFVCQKK